MFKLNVGQKKKKDAEKRLQSYNNRTRVKKSTYILYGFYVYVLFAKFQVNSRTYDRDFIVVCVGDQIAT